MTTPDLFMPAVPTGRQGQLAINRHATWHTWSPWVRHVIAESEAWLRRLPEPELIHVSGLVEYDYTYALAASPPRPLQRLARSLCRLKPPDGIMLFTGLFDGCVDGFVLRRLFALLRGGIAAILGDERFSLYAPLGTTGRQVGDFPLHADLYLPELLFNVFEDVPADSSGASIFLRVAELDPVMNDLGALPSAVRVRIAACLRSVADEDRFGELFDLLHDRSQPWVRDLESAMRARQISIRLAAGQGYLIHDRTWLHGREAPSRGVSPRRVHRLVFNSLGMRQRIRPTAALRGSARFRGGSLHQRPPRHC